MLIQRCTFGDGRVGDVGGALNRREAVAAGGAIIDEIDAVWNNSWDLPVASNGNGGAYSQEDGGIEMPFVILKEWNETKVKWK